MAAATEKYVLAAQATLLSTELNALADNALAIAGTAFDNTQGQTGDGYTLCDVTLDVTFASAPTANTGCALWFLAMPDGTNAEQGGASVTPARLPDCVFPLLAVTTQQVINRRVMLPWGKFKALLKDDGTGRAFPASGSTVKVRAATRQMV